MQFCVLVPVELAAEGRRVALSSDRQRAVLAALLAVPGEVVSADRLVEAVWGNHPPASAQASLHSHISRLRRALAAVAGGGPDPLLTETGGYRIELGVHDLDAAGSEALLDEAHTDGAADPRQAVALLDEALGLWRGPAFGEPVTAHAVRAAATRLEQQRAAGIADRVDAVLALGGNACTSRCCARTPRSRRRTARRDAAARLHPPCPTRRRPRLGASRTPISSVATTTSPRSPR